MHIFKGLNMKLIALLLLLSSDSSAFCFQDNIEDFLSCIESEEIDEPQESDFEEECEQTFILKNPTLEHNKT